MQWHKESVNALVQTLNGGEEKPTNTDVVCAPTAIYLDYVQSNLRSDYEVCVQTSGLLMVLGHIRENL